MAAADTFADVDDRQAHRRHGFSTWVKKLTNFKHSEGERAKRHMKRSKKKSRASKNNNPYPDSGIVSNGTNGHNGYHEASINGASECSLTTGQPESHISLQHQDGDSVHDRSPQTAGGVSAAGTASTEHVATRSITARSHGASSLAGTSRTVGGGLESRRGGDSTFSSPAPSVRSLTTTLTTIQSAAPNGTGTGHSSSANNQGQQQSIQFSQPFPTTSPASAIPAHLAPTGNPTTYVSATANNLLLDNASTLTLASSSKRRRRRSMDTDASVQALAPSSVWGGSRESLPLSVLSANIETGGITSASGIHGSSSRMGAERNSIYSTTGVGSGIAGDRNSLYAKQGDGASIRSGLLGHGRNDSVGGGNAVSSPLASPLETPTATAGPRVDKENSSAPKLKDEQA